MLNSVSTQSSIRIPWWLGGVVIGFLAQMSMLPAAYAMVIATTTQLTVSAPSVAVGLPTLLVATVTDAANRAVVSGTVTFYDGSRSLGSAQIVRLAGGSFAQGTASFNVTSFSRGANSITAVYAGTTAYLASTSSAKTVTVTGLYRTAESLTTSVSQGQYALTATLQSFGVGLPMGSIDFLNTETDSMLGSLPLSGAARSSGPAISPSYTVSNESNQVGVLVGDFNGDGIPDLAVPALPNGSLSTDSMVSILLGKGDGTFQPQIDYALGFFSYPLCVGDFNNDGKLDLMVEYGLPGIDNAFGIMLGNGDGTFQPQLQYGTAGLPRHAYTADFNRDGNLDLVVVHDYAPGLSIFMGKGDGTFEPEQIVAADQGSPLVVVGDLNGDGIADLVLSSGQVLLGKGDGTFTPTSSFLFGGAPVALMDMNGDGVLDVVAVDTGVISICLGNGDGTFRPQTSYGVDGRGPVAVADFNGDGKLDVAVANGSDNEVFMLRGNGDGTLQPAIPYLSNSSNKFAWIYSLIQADMNGDGRSDLIAGYSEDDGMFTLARGYVAFSAETATVQLQNVAAPVTGDMPVEARYSGDETFAASTSNVAQLLPTIIDLSGGFSQAAVQIQFNGGSAIVGTGLQLTSAAVPQTAASAFTKTPMNIQSFTTDFTFQILDPVADGFTFTIQNDGPGAVGNSGGGLGYVGISKSVALAFDIYDNSYKGHNNIVGVYINGPTGLTTSAYDLTGTGLDLHNGRLFKAHVTYDGAALTMTLTDTVAGWTSSYSWPVDIPSAVGGTTAYLGFTGGTGNKTSTQTINSWSYAVGTPLPNYPAGFNPPKSPRAGPIDLSLNGSPISVQGTALYLAELASYAATTAFNKTPVNVQSFTTDFAFQNNTPVAYTPNADGFTFTLQNDAPTAIGGSGGGLGYANIPKSVAVKFDLHDNAGEGSNSTGVYADGAFPGSPSVELTGTPIDLHSQHTFKAHITYDGATLTMTLTDAVTHGTWSHSWSVDIPTTVGGTSAYVGFTAGTGKEVSSISLSRWVYTTGTPASH